MAFVFWDRKGIILIEFLPQGDAITAARYCEALQELKRASIQTKRREIFKKRVCLFRDNNHPPSHGQRHQGAFELVWLRHFEPPCIFPWLSAFGFSSFHLPEDWNEWKKISTRWRGKTRGLEVDDGVGRRVLWRGRQKACAATYNLDRTGKQEKNGNAYTYNFL